MYGLSNFIRYKGRFASIRLLDYVWHFIGFVYVFYLFYLFVLL